MMKWQTLLNTDSWGKAGAKDQTGWSNGDNRVTDRGQDTASSVRRDPPQTVPSKWSHTAFSYMMTGSQNFFNPSFYISRKS